MNEELTALHKIFKKSSGISTDTRTLKPGQLFFALKGERFNGNLHAAAALEKGAIAAVIDENVDGIGPSIKVHDALKALQELATYHRNQFQIPVLAVGGSNGKTTTKELLRHVLSKKYRLTVTQGNLNNHIGVPLTMLQINELSELALIEIGTNHPGEIRSLCEILNPTHGLITNIGKEHLEGFGSMEGVAREESELFHFLQKTDGLAFVNSNDPWLMQMAQRLSKKKLYGVAAGTPDYSIYQIRPLRAFPSLSYQLPDAADEGTSGLFGSFNFENIAAAAAVGHFFEVKNSEILAAIAAYVPDNMRSQVKHMGGKTLILDCYNANPSSMEKALKDFAAMPGEKLAILGDMLELGAHAAAEHAAIAELCGSLNIEKTLGIGPEFFKTVGSPMKTFPITEEATDWLSENYHRYNAILLKGSRGIGLEKLLEVIAPNEALAPH